MPLRKLTNEIDVVNSDAASLAEAVDKLEADFPGIKERIVGEDGGDPAVREHLREWGRRALPRQSLDAAEGGG